MILIETEEQFHEAIQSNKTVAVDFFTSTCSSCKAAEKVLEKLEQELKDISFFKADAENLINIAIKYSMSSMPCLLIFKLGKLVNQVVGFKTKQAYSEELQK